MHANFVCIARVNAAAALTAVLKLGSATSMHHMMLHVYATASQDRTLRDFACWRAFWRKLEQPW